MLPVIGFNPDNAEILTEAANFEWAYGLNGAIKGAVPRFLGFEDSYDSQFYYYLYDTSYPWNGPLFGIQYALNDIPCCPNTTCNDENSGRPRPCCIPNDHYYSHFYQIRQDSWETTKSKLVLSDESTNAVNESFEIIDTDSPRILFRYTTRDGDFNKGDTINGWNIVSVFYYGDKAQMWTDGGWKETEMTSHISKLSPLRTVAHAKSLLDTALRTNVRLLVCMNSPKGCHITRLKLSPKALIPNRTLDEAKLEAIINNKGGIKEIEIVNSGRGYSKNAKVNAITPKVLKNFSSTDTTEHLEDLIKKDSDIDQAIGFTETELKGDDPIKDVQGAFGAVSGDTPFPLEYDNIAQKLSAAKLEIAAFDEIGGIKAIRVIDPGSGYDPDEAHLTCLLVILSILSMKVPILATLLLLVRAFLTHSSI